MRTYYIAIISCLLALSCKYALAMDALVKAGEPSGDLSQSTLWAVQSIHAPDLFQQFGVSHSPSQWHLLNDDTVQAMFTNVGQKIGNSLLSERVQLSCLVARDMQKAQPAHDQKKKQVTIFTTFLRTCLPSSMLRNLDQQNLEKIEATAMVPLLRYVSTALNEENNTAMLDVRTRGYRVRLEKLIEKNGKPDAVESKKKLDQIRRRINSTVAPKPSADIMVLASTMLGESTAAGAAACVADQSPLPTFNPTDSVLITQELQGAKNIYSYLTGEKEKIEGERALLNTLLGATETVLGTAEISKTHYVRQTLEEYLEQKKQVYNALQDRYEAYERAQSDVHQQVDTAHQTLAERQQERSDALSKVNEQILIATSRLTTVEGFLSRATKMKAERERELEQLRMKREEILSAQERLQPGLQAVAEFKKQ